MQRLLPLASGAVHFGDRVGGAHEENGEEASVVRIDCLDSADLMERVYLSDRVAGALGSLGGPQRRALILWGARDQSVQDVAVAPRAAKADRLTGPPDSDGHFAHCNVRLSAPQGSVATIWLSCRMEYATADSTAGTGAVAWMCGNTKWQTAIMTSLTAVDVNGAYKLRATRTQVDLNCGTSG